MTLPELKENPILRALTLQPKISAIKRGKFVSSTVLPRHYMFDIWWLRQQIEEATEVETILDCLEAATAQEVFVSRSELFAEIIARAIERVDEFVRKTGISSARFIELIRNRMFWGRDGEIYGRPQYGPSYETEISSNWHVGRMTDFLRILRERSSLNDSVEIGIAAAISDFQSGNRRFEPEDADFLTEFIEQNGLISFRLYHLWGVSVGKESELEFVLSELEALETQAITSKKGRELLNQGFAMFEYVIKYCATTLNIDNAKSIVKRFDESYARRRVGITVPSLINLASRICDDSAPSGLVDGSRLAIELPLAMDIIIDVILNRGQNNLSDEQRLNISTFVKLAADVFVLGQYFNDKRFSGKTISEYLESRPGISAERLADEINSNYGGREKLDSRYKNLRGKFGSVVYWKLNRRGYGYYS